MRCSRTFGDSRPRLSSGQTPRDWFEDWRSAGLDSGLRGRSSRARPGLWVRKLKVRREGEYVIPPELRNRYVGRRKRQATCVRDVRHVKPCGERAIIELESVPQPNFQRSKGW